MTETINKVSVSWQKKSEEDERPRMLKLSECVSRKIIEVLASKLRNG